MPERRFKLHGKLCLVDKPTKQQHSFEVKKEVVDRFNAGLKDKKSWWRVSPSCFGGGLCGGGRARQWHRPIWG